MHCRSVTGTPRISVIISSYNNARFVSKKLAEIRAQTIFAESEFVFVETGSPEKERELFAPFCAEHPHCRIVACAERKTLYQAWNMGWRAARAPLVCYSNMDDAMHPRLLELIPDMFLPHSCSPENTEQVVEVLGKARPEDTQEKQYPAHYIKQPVLIPGMVYFNRQGNDACSHIKERMIFYEARYIFTIGWY